MNHWSYYKLVYFKVSNGFLLVVAMSFIAGTDGIEWHILTPFQKARLIILCLVAGGKFLEGFFDQTLSRMEKDEQLKSYQNGDTTTIKKGQT